MNFIAWLLGVFKRSAFNHIAATNKTVSKHYSTTLSPFLLFTDKDCVTATQISSVSGTSQIGHQLQVISVSIHKTRH